MKKIYSCVVITGASSGIGLSMAKQVAPLTKQLVLVARRQELLQKTSQELSPYCTVNYFATDLTNETQIEKLCRDFEQAKIQPDILINNAGFGLYGSFQESDLKKEQEMVQLNIQALMSLSKWGIRSMKNAGHQKATVLNVASVAAFSPGPYMAVYFASKAFVLSFSEAIDQELQGTGIRVLALCPGNTQSEFHQVAGSERVKWMHKLSKMDSEQVAKQALWQIQKGKSVHVTGLLNQVMIMSTKLLPRAIAKWASARLLRH